MHQQFTRSLPQETETSCNNNSSSYASTTDYTIRCTVSWMYVHTNSPSCCFLFIVIDEHITIMGAVLLHDGNFDGRRGQPSVAAAPKKNHRSSLPCPLKVEPTRRDYSRGRIIVRVCVATKILRL